MPKGGKRPGAGRPKGVANKDKQALLQTIRDALGDQEYHPVVEMARVAADETKEDSLRMTANKEVAQYVSPKLKQVENQVRAIVESMVTVPAVADTESFEKTAKRTKGLEE